jgi:hypothetical protein
LRTILIVQARSVTIPEHERKKNMRSFSWKVFAMTGDVDAYLLYKAFNRPYDNRDLEDESEEEEPERPDDD